MNEQQDAALTRLLQARDGMRDARQAFIDAARECRWCDIDEDLLNLALTRDRRQRGELDGWALLDQVFAAEAR
jgi:hypothetical protein